MGRVWQRCLGEDPKEVCMDGIRLDNRESATDMNRLQEEMEKL